MNTADRIVPQQPHAKRLSSAEFRSAVGGRIQLLGVDAPPDTPDDMVLGVVEFPGTAAIMPSFVALVADAVVERLRQAPAPIAEPERVFIDAAEAAAILGISRDAFDKRVQRRQVPGVVRTAGRRIQIDKAKMLSGLAKRGR